MWDFEQSSLVKANRDYNCQACECVLDNVEAVQEFTIGECYTMNEAALNNYKIKKGDTYLKVKGKWVSGVYLGLFQLLMIYVLSIIYIGSEFDEDTND